MSGEYSGVPLLIVGNFLSNTIGNYNVCEELADRLTQSSWKVLTVSSKPGRIARLADMVTTTWLRRQDYRVAQVDVYSGPAFFLAEAVCWTLRKAGKPYVLTLHGGRLPVFSTKWPSRVKRLLSSAAAVTVPSRFLLEQMSRYSPDLLLLPNPLEISAYHFSVRKKARPRLIWLRAFEELYNPSLACRVVHQLVQEFPDINLKMVGHDKGDGSMETVRRLVSDLGIADRIEMTGGIPKAKVPATLNSGDIFLNTTNVDNTPISVLEAMASGLCVVSTNVGGLPYLLEDGNDALLVPANDANAMAEAVRRILRRPDLAEQLSRNGRSKVENYDWSVILPQCKELYARVVDHL
jgi:glycosyltransferase involved in cell wall biosynthesis